MIRMTLTMTALALAAPAFAQTTPDAAAPAATTAPATAGAAAAPAPGKPNVVAGAQVVDTTGAAVGSIEAVANGIATLSTGTTKVGIPVGSFAANGDKLVVALTKAQVDAQGAPAKTAGAATGGAAGAAPAAGAATAIAVGATVNDSTGAKVGTVKAVNGDLVTVASDTASAQLPKTAFAQSGEALVIGLSAAEFEKAAKAAGGSKAAATKG